MTGMGSKVRRISLDRVRLTQGELEGVGQKVKAESREAYIVSEIYMHHEDQLIGMKPQ